MFTLVGLWSQPVRRSALAERSQGFGEEALVSHCHPFRFVKKFVGRRAYFLVLLNIHTPVWFNVNIYISYAILKEYKTTSYSFCLVIFSIPITTDVIS